jgi:membrane protein
MSDSPSLTPPPPEADPLVPGPAPSAFDRARARKDALRARAQEVAERAEAARADHRTLDVGFEAVARDVEVGGGIIAGALAYRFFIWLLPFGLVLVAGLGIAADAAGDSPVDAAKTLGLAGIVSQSIASAASGANRWYALIVGVPVLVYVTRSVLRALIGAHRLVWTDLRAAAPRPTPKATLRLLGLLLAFFVATGLAGAARAWSTGPGIVISLLMVAPYTGFWLLVTMRLPHRDAGWKALLPGALAFGVGIELIQLFTALVIAPMSLTKQGTYGALGIAAALLFGLYLIARLMVGAAVINATLWDRQLRTQESDSITR